MLRAQPFARRFTTVSWWDDDRSVRAFVRTDPHRAAMVRWRPETRHRSNSAHPGTPGVVPTVASAAATTS